MIRTRVRCSLFAVAALALSASAAGQHIHVDFDNLVQGAVVTNQYPELTFSSDSGFVNVTDNTYNLGTSQPNYICTASAGGSLTCTNSTFVDFTNPVSNLRFYEGGDNQSGTVAQVRIFVAGSFTATFDVVGDSNFYVANLVDLSAYNGITRIEIVNIVDGGGLAWDDFEFDPSSAVGFCYGDGSSTACPCGNDSVPGLHQGCLNSLGIGATLSASGVPSIAQDTVVLAGANMPNSSALYFQGTMQLNGGLGIPFGDGLRCVGGSVLRLGIHSNAGGASQYPVAGDPSVSVRGLVTAPGTRVYQVWYRNAATFCTPGTYNLSNGLEITWGA